jgi:hypothetical protein
MTEKSLKVIRSLATIIGAVLLTTISVFASERTVLQMAKSNESAMVSVASRTNSIKSQIHHSGSTQCVR